MSKTQAKINFVEQKKTSARLRDAFNRKEKRISSKIINKTEHAIVQCTSPKKLVSPIKVKPVCKETISLYSSYDKFSDKENKTRALETKSVVSSVYQSPVKNINKLEESPEERYLVKSLPLKRGAVSTSVKRVNDEESSPPKRECSSSPEQTPSQFISKLALGSPERQPKSNSRKELFPKGHFDEACKALHSSATTTLPGREDKLDYVKEYLSQHAREQTSGTLYISGPPGTGKTASVTLAITDPKIAQDYKIISLNCTAMNSCTSVYSRIANELKLKAVGRSEKSFVTAIENYFESKKRKMILIVLDELDQLCNSKQSVLYSIFEWPTLPQSRMVLIGIANALDLTDRVLPRLQARLSLQPTVVHFPSYTRQQIIDIIVHRLQQAGVEDVLSGATLQLLAGKVAAVNGDVRRALDIARRVVEVAERRTVLQPLTDNVSNQQTVTLQEVLSVVNNVYNTAHSLDSCQSGSFPLQQKLLICALLLVRQSSKSKDIAIGKLHEVYKKVCERRNMTALDISEFISLTSLVEARGVLRIIGKSHNRLSKKKVMESLSSISTEESEVVISPDQTGCPLPLFPPLLICAVIVCLLPPYLILGLSLPPSHTILFTHYKIISQYSAYFLSCLSTIICCSLPLLINLKY